MRERIKALAVAILVTFLCAVFLLVASTALSRVFGGEPEDKALEAAYIQTGVKGEVDRVGQYVERVASEKVLSKSALLRLGVAAYASYRRQCVKWPWTDRLSVTLYQDKVEVGFFF